LKLFYCDRMGCVSEGITRDRLEAQMSIDICTNAHPDVDAKGRIKSAEFIDDEATHIARATNRNNSHKKAAVLIEGRCRLPLGRRGVERPYLICGTYYDLAQIEH